MTKFTAGPWQWGGAYPQDHRYPTSVWAGERFIAATDGMTAPCEGSDEEQAANARLIAATPDLISLASRVRDFLIGLQIEFPSNGTIRALLDESRETLDKALGMETH